MTKKAFFVVALVAIAAAVASAAGRVGLGANAASPPSCQLANGIKHVIYLQFDNVHYRC